MSDTPKVPASVVPAQITPPRFAVGDRIDRFGVTYEFVGKDADGKNFIRLDTRAAMRLGNVELLEMMVAREVTMAVPSWLPSCRTTVWRQDFHSRPEHQKRAPRRRQEYVQAFSENRRLGYPHKVAAVLEAVHRTRMNDKRNVEAGETAPSLAAVYSWMAIAEKPEGPRGIRRLCFAESESGRRGVQISVEMKPHVMTAIRELWFTPQRHRVGSIYDRAIASASQDQVPATLFMSRRTIRRLIAGMSPYLAMRARQGARAADLKYRSVGQLDQAVLPGQIYEIDAHKLDFMAVDNRMGLPLGRLWVTAVIDRCTRMIVGFHIHVEPPSALTIAAALRNAFAPKPYIQRRWPEIRANVAWGLPEMLILDNGLENHARFLMEGLEELGVAWQFAPARTPEFKPHIERFFGTLTRDFTARLPGWTGSNPREKGDYDTAAMACLRLNQADELLHRWVANYNVTSHQGIQDIPEAKWTRLTKELEVAPIEDIGILDILLGDYALRTPDQRGIHLLGLRYGDLGDNRPLEMIRTRAGGLGVTKVRVRFDRSDLSYIWVQDPLTKEYVWVASLDPSYTKELTLAQHRIIRRHAIERCRGYLSIAELCTSRDDLQRRIDEMTGAEPMTERRFAQVYDGIGAKGSWSEFYRLTQAEYGIDRKENLELSVVQLLEADEGGIAAPPPPAPPPDVDPTPAATGIPAQAQVSAADAGESLAARAERLGMKITGVNLPTAPDAAAVTPDPIPPAAAPAPSLAERMAELGMNKGGARGR